MHKSYLVRTGIILAKYLLTCDILGLRVWAWLTISVLFSFCLTWFNSSSSLCLPGLLPLHSGVPPVHSTSRSGGASPEGPPLHLACPTVPEPPSILLCAVRAESTQQSVSVSLLSDGSWWFKTCYKPWDLFSSADYSTSADLMSVNGFGCIQLWTWPRAEAQRSADHQWNLIQGDYHLLQDTFILYPDW